MSKTTDSEVQKNGTSKCFGLGLVDYAESNSDNSDSESENYMEDQNNQNGLHVQNCVGIRSKKPDSSNRTTQNTILDFHSKEICASCQNQRTDYVMKSTAESLAESISIGPDDSVSMAMTKNLQCSCQSNSKKDLIDEMAKNSLTTDDTNQDHEMMDESSCKAEELDDMVANRLLSSISTTVPRSLAPLPNENKQNGVKKIKLESEEDDLSLPNSIQSMFQRQSKWKDNPNEHDNRVRSFPHVEGNWATHVFIEVEWNSNFFDFVNRVLDLVKPVPFHALPEFHISLSRTVAIRHHWIEPLVDSLRIHLKTIKASLSDLSTVKLFTNDEKTRTFLCLEISEEDTDVLKGYVEAVDKSFAEFKLQKYYENPSFHISIGWCLGDVTAQISEDTMGQVKAIFGEFMATYSELSVVYARHITCRSGNKCFAIPLLDDSSS